mmetsp:Transcript_24396/g.35236  ORF Transcript_24396/g.35236 Transcript_24396/m.35236 type:complete len:96 (-) Transcript_24396:104-391(-)
MPKSTPMEPIGEKTLTMKFASCVAPPVFERPTETPKDRAIVIMTGMDTELAAFAMVIHLVNINRNDVINAIVSKFIRFTVTIVIMVITRNAHISM